LIFDTVATPNLCYDPDPWAQERAALVEKHRQEQEVRRRAAWIQGLRSDTREQVAEEAAAWERATEERAVGYRAALAELKKQLRRTDDRGERLMLETRKRELEEQHVAKEAEMEVLRVDLEVRMCLWLMCVYERRQENHTCASFRPSFVQKRV